MEYDQFKNVKYNVHKERLRLKRIQDTDLQFYEVEEHK